VNYLFYSERSIERQINLVELDQTQVMSSQGKSLNTANSTRLKRLILGSRRKIINFDYRLDSLDGLDSLDRLDRLDSLDRMDRLDRLDRLDRTCGLGPVGWEWDHFIEIFCIGKKSKFNQL
jgi:hypothetical protein